MAFDRDETILRLAVADMANPRTPIIDGEEGEWADFVVRCADALLARLRPEAVGVTTRDAVEATFPVGSKVRVVRPTSSPSQRERFPVGSIETVCGYDQYDGGWRLLVADNKGWVLPCECVEAVAPAATTAPYVPRVGDVVVACGIVGEHIGTVVGMTMGTNSIQVKHPCYAGAFERVEIWPSTSLRPATASERAAAGLPVDAPRSVDRVALAKVLREAYQDATLGGLMGPWEESSESARKGYLAEVDAALAYLKANGGVA